MARRESKQFRKENLNRVSPSLLVGCWQMKDFIPTLNTKTKRFLPKTSEGRKKSRIWG
jgi:hypothetical protein